MNTKLSTNRKFKRMFTSILSIFAILAMAFPVTGGASAQESNPFLRAFPDWNVVDGGDWPLGASVHLAIDDPATVDDPDYVDDATVVVSEEGWISTYVRFDFGYDLKRGDKVMLSADGISRYLIVSELWVTTLDVENNIVGGTFEGAEIGTTVHVFVGGDAQLYVTTDSEGAWVADFDDVGFDLLPGTQGAVEVWFDEFNDSTIFNWNVSWLIAFPENDAVEGLDWPVGKPVTLTIDSATNLAWEGTPEARPWGDTHFRIEFGNDYDLKVGDVVTLTDEFGTTRIHTVQNLSITEVDINADTVAGTADPGVQLQVWAHQQSDPPVDVTADENGNWLADLTGVYDIVPGTAGRSQITVDGNATAVDWAVPFIWADPLCECLNGWNWRVGDSITIQVFDQYNNELELQNPTQVYSAESGAAFELQGEGIDLQAGYRITMSNGLITKELIVSSLVVKEMNPVANTISGVFDPSLPLFVHVENQEALSYDFDGDQWVATFASLDGFGEAYQPDDDGDKTGMGWDGVPTFMRYDIYAFDGQSGNIQRITTLDGTGEYNPSWSPNGKKVVHDVVYWDGFQNLYITDVATQNSAPLIGGEGGNDGVWSPNGKWIAFDRDSTLYLIPSTGGEATLVREDAISADWAPNGKRLVFQQPSDGSIRTVAVDGGNGGETLITHSGANPVWSPNGNWIAYENGGDIWKVQVNVQGTVFGDPIQVTGSPFEDGQPTWSADSMTIVYHSGFTSDWDLWSVPAAGGMGTWLNGAPDFGDYDPSYAKNSSNIAYASPSPDGQATRFWSAAFSYDVGTWATGDHNYYLEDAYSVPEPGGETTPVISFTVSGEAQQYDGFVLLRGFALRARVGDECPSIDPPVIHADQNTRFHYGWVTDFPMTYAEALAHFDSMTVTAFWDDGMSEPLVQHEIFPLSSVDWSQYVCAATAP